MTLALIGLCFQGFSQRQANIWMFGDGLSLDFNCVPPRPFKVGASIDGDQGRSAISDKCGDLLMYSNGSKLWDMRHNIVRPFGDMLSGSPLSTQSSLIIPSRQDPTKYYLFTVDADENLNQNGLSYSNITVPTVAPIITAANQLLVRQVNEMISACEHANGRDDWVVVKVKNKAEFRAYKIDLNGVDTSAVVSKAGIAIAESGQMKLSPDGKWLVIRKPFQIFRFDNNTGEVIPFISDFSNIKDFLAEGNSVEFSPNSRFLYINNWNPADPPDNGYCQFDLGSGDSSKVKTTAFKIKDGGASPKGGMQLAPDGNIYVLDDPMNFRVSVIRFPNEQGSGCIYEDNVILMNGKVGLFFPTFNQSYFKDEHRPVTENLVCFSDTTLFSLNTSYWAGVTDNEPIDSITFNFDDPNSGPENNLTVTTDKPRHVFTQTGCFTVRMEVFTGKGSYQAQRVMRISELPTLDIGPPDTTLCTAPRNIQLFAQIGNNPGATYRWYYDTLGAPTGGPGSVGEKFPITFDPDVKATLTGKYWVKKSWKCCDAWDTITVYHDSIIPKFKLNDNLQCERDNNFIFSNTTTNADSTIWDFDYGPKKYGLQGVVHYPTIGTYHPKMTTLSANGCKGTIGTIVLVVKHPVARFFTDTAALCFKGNVFKVSDSSTIEKGHGSLQSWRFDLGDSAATSQKQFTKSYTKPGTYTMRLVVTSSQQCRDTAYQLIQVFEQPKSGFRVDDTTQCLSTNLFEYTDTSREGIDAINFREWTYGDGSPKAERTGQPLSHTKTYGSVDSFKVQLRTGSGIGCYDTATHYVHVFANPYVDFTIDAQQQCLNSNKYNFIDTTHVIKGTVATRMWDFGDSTPIGNSGLNKIYKKYGSYTVKFKAISNKGCADSISKSILLHPMPTAAFTVSDSITCFKNHTFDFSAAPSFIPVGTISSYNWDFGDGTIASVVDPSPLVYAQDTSHLVSLTLFSDKGCKDSVAKVIKFFPTPKAVISVNNPVQCIEENLFYYTADGSDAPGGNIKEYLWQFGDGTIDVGKTPNGKFYVNPRDYNVQLQVTTDDNCSDTTSVNVKILPSPVADFSVSPSCLFQPNIFTDKSTANPGKLVAWNWRLGDNTTSKDSSPVHTYSNTGTYTVTLEVISDFGCSASVTKINEAVVKALPEAKFGIIKTEYDEKNTTIQFVDSSIDVDQWYWELGAGKISTQQHPLEVYDDTATVPVKLIVSNDEGCYDSITQNIFVAPDFMFYVPNAFTPNNGDELNRYFGGEGTRYFKDYSLRIFNRWGEMVFESKNALHRWDGTFKGEFCPAGAYTYIYALRDVYGFYHNYKGVINLIR
ncbi:MAG TPA: PKD domain-containing protein [Bacteroidia bacterium]|nr:PKD domain-containing protein [Bacteroidia bacterium]